MSQRSILYFLGKTNAGFLHANGEKATEILVHEFPTEGIETVLEIGCGTGATLVKVEVLDKLANSRLSTPLLVSGCEDYDEAGAMRPLVPLIIRRNTSSTER